MGGRESDWEVKKREDEKDETEGDRRIDSVEDEESEIEERKSDTK